MGRKAYITVTKWPVDQLTTVGQVTSCCTCGSEDHIGVFIPCATAEEIRWHSDPAVSHASARQAEHVAFDYMTDLRPWFQSYTNSKYYTPEADVLLYPILVATASDVHAACLEAARRRPRNSCCYRCNAVCWCVPCACAPATGRMRPSTCVALTMRVIAYAAAGNDSEAFRSDTFVFEHLGLRRFGSAAPTAPQFLTGHTPRSALNALQKAGVVGLPVSGFAAAVSQCGYRLERSGPTGPYPLLSLSSLYVQRMER